MISPVCVIPPKKKKKVQMNLFAEQKQTHRLKNLWLPKRTGWEMDRGLGLAYAH